MTRVGIVCDSTCDLGPEWLAQHDVTMVPLKVLFGDDSYLDWIDLSPDEFYKKLAASASLPKTSQPSPSDFTKAYVELAEAGCTEIVSVHLTSALSGTFESATLAAVTSPVPIRVVDTKTVSMATALAIEAAVEVRDAGGSATEVETAARKTADSSRLYFILDTLDYLVKGGRAGKAAGLAASVLNIKPILTFTPEGTIEPFKKVKGLKKALAELAAQVAADSGGTRLRLSVLHGAAPELADQMVAALDAAGVEYELDMIGSVGAVIGTYAGPGAVGLAYYPMS
jgi:DegV family protein with EDD domain